MAGSLCTGIGGLDLAAHAVYGCELAWYAEVDPAAALILGRIYPGVPNLGDLTTVDWTTVKPVDVLTAGYPCQPFSTAGRRQGTDDDRHLWPHIAAAVRVLRPRRVVLENVAGHLSLGFGDVLGDVAAAGFDAEWCVLRASDVGAPHQRARLFVVAADADGEGPQGPQPARRRDLPAGSGRQPAPHADGGRLVRGPQPDLRAQQPRLEAPRRGDPHGLAVGDHRTSWGHYERAIRRWEHVLGRPAPAPTDDRGRLSPAFVEWMMGYPPGWTADLSRTQALKALGNAVVPQQGTAAVALLEEAYRSPACTVGTSGPVPSITGPDENERNGA